MKPATHNHVTTPNVATATDALKAAIAYEQANEKIRKDHNDCSYNIQ
jgi:hypothetical protein